MSTAKECEERALFVERLLAGETIETTRNQLLLFRLQDQLDADEQWRQVSARADRRRYLALVIGAVILGAIVLFGGLI